MRVCNLTPFPVVTKLVSLHPPQPEMMVMVRASYRVAADGSLSELLEPTDQGSPNGDVFSEEERGGECTHASDFADFKLTAEVLVEGHCHAPAGEAVTQCPLQVSVGHWKKLLRVVGKRHWQTTAFGKKPSEPEAFVRMPLRWSHAYGGEGVKDNPVGGGADGVDLPCLEYPDEPMLAPSDRPRAAGLGPIHSQWPARAGKQGTRYGGDYQKKRAPFFAEDFDWSFFNAAPADQQLDGYLRGDEDLAFYNLHPDAAVVKTRLPAMKTRVFVKDHHDNVREVPMVCDTLTVELDERRIHLSWRGIIAVQDDDFDDIRTVLVTMEPLTGPAHTLAECRQRMVAFEADPTGILDTLADLIAQQKRQQEDRPLEPDEDTGNPISNLLKRKWGDTKPDVQAKVLAAIESARESTPAEQRDKLEEQLQTGAEAADVDAPPPRRSNKPGSIPAPNQRPQMRKVLAAAADLRSKIVEVETPNAELAVQLPEGFAPRPRKLPDEQRAKLMARIDELEQVPHNRHLKELDPEYEPPLEPLSDDAPGPGCDLREHDLSDRDLSGMDLSGARFDLAVLCRTNFSGCNLRGASFHRAVLYKANFSDADLTGANLTKVNGTFAVACRATFDGATLDEAYFEDANLREAKFNGASGEYIIFTRSDLTGTCGKGAQWPNVDFVEAQLTGASFEEANLNGARFDQAQAARLNLTRAKLTGARLPEADLQEAKLSEIHAPGCQWQRANLDHADLTLALLCNSDFTKARARHATLYGANLREARLYRTDLSDANLEAANLFRADCRKARLDRTRLVSANLYEAVLLQASGQDTDLRDAVLTRSTLAGDD